MKRPRRRNLRPVYATNEPRVRVDKAEVRRLLELMRDLERDFTRVLGWMVADRHEVARLAARGEVRNG